VSADENGLANGTVMDAMNGTRGSMDELMQLPPEDMERAYLEFRKACYEIVFRSFVDWGGMKCLARPRDVFDFASAMGVHTSRIGTVRLLLEAMTRYGVVARSGNLYFARTTGFSGQCVDEELIFTATGKRNVRRLRDWMNYAGIVPALVRGLSDVGAPFDRDHLPLWKEAMAAPYYRYSRLTAVRYISAAGSRFLDLGCGLGNGLRELAAYAPRKDIEIVGVEISKDMADYASEVTHADWRVSVLHGNAESLPSDLKEFDGVMLVGVYHFLRQPEKVWNSLSRMMRPSGRVCLAYTRTTRESYDRQLMDLRYATRASSSQAYAPAEVVDMAAHHGFEIEHILSMGVWGTFSFVFTGDHCVEFHGA
jgi:SAM-dependent methyltransferase